MTIAEMQEAIRAKGWQWAEHVFNDGDPRDCMLEFTQDTSPHALSNYPRPEDRIGWGRFSRQWAWTQAYNWIVEDNQQR